MNPAALTYSVRYSVLLHFVAILVIILGLLNFASILFSLITQEWKIAGINALISFFLIGLGFLFVKLFPGEKIQANEAVVIICLMYLITALLMTPPFLFANVSFLDAFFETVSCITTTGLSVIGKFQKIPKTIDFSRAWMQWFGGLGIVVFSFMLFFKSGETTKKLGTAGSIPDDLIGGTHAYAKKIIIAYTVLTCMAILLCFIFGSTLYDSILYSFAAVSTGGFSPYRSNFSELNIASQSIIIIFSFLGACSLKLFYNSAVKRNWRWSEMNVQFLLLASFSVLVTLWIGFSIGSWRNAWLLGFCAQTTTGFSILDLGKLDSHVKLVLIFSMFIGGSVGSTAGGLKLLRFMILFYVLILNLQRMNQPAHIYTNPALFGKPLSEKGVERAFTTFFLFIGVNALSWLAFLVYGYAPIDALFEVVSATATVGLSTGITGSEMPSFLKGILCLDMLFGRLEVLPWLLLFWPETWLKPTVGDL